MRRPFPFPSLVITAAATAAVVCGGLLLLTSLVVPPSLRAAPGPGNGTGGAKAFAIVDAGTGHVLANREGDTKVQVASLTKVATAVVVLDWAESGGGGGERGKLDDPVTITPAALTAGGINSVGFAPGDVVSARDLLYAMMLGSDNVAAEALAAHIGRSLGGGGGGSSVSPTVAFVAQMNALARSLGMERTRFLNPTGADTKEKPFSTAVDMARLTRHALEKASFRFIVAQKERRLTVVRPGAVVPPPAPAAVVLPPSPSTATTPPPTSGGFVPPPTTTGAGAGTPALAPSPPPAPTPPPGVVITVRNTNELLGVQRVDGVKTGQTARAGSCLILTAERDKLVKPVPGQVDSYDITHRRLIVVLLGSPDRFREGVGLLNRGQSLYDAWAAAGMPTGGDNDRR